jgi:hypothetical protein
MSRLWCIALIVVAAATQVRAGEPFVLPVTTLSASPESVFTVRAQCESCPTAAEALFQPGATSMQVLGGMYFSGPWGPRSRQFNFVPISVRQGVMVTAPEEHWWGRGNYECLVDATAASITTSYGSYFTGLTFFGRMNWVEPGAEIVPYAQVGTGGIVNDAYRDQTQHAIGQAFEFYLHAELGLRIFIAPDLTLDLEGGLQHISNGGMASRNYGVNTYGGTIGFTYHFPNP